MGDVVSYDVSTPLGYLTTLPLALQFSCKFIHDYQADGLMTAEQNQLK